MWALGIHILRFKKLLSPPDLMLLPPFSSVGTPLLLSYFFLKGRTNSFRTVVKAQTSPGWRQKVQCLFTDMPAPLATSKDLSSQRRCSCILKCSAVPFGKAAGGPKGHDTYFSHLFVLWSRAQNIAFRKKKSGPQSHPLSTFKCNVSLLFSGLTYAHWSGGCILSSCFHKHDKNSICSIIITSSTRGKFYYASNCFVFIIKIVSNFFFFVCFLMVAMRPEE